MNHKILVFVESRYIGDTMFGEFFDSQEFKVSTRKLEQFKEEYSHEYGYIQRLIEQALAGKLRMETGRKYSFSDAPDWYETLRPDADCSDIEVAIDVRFSF